MIGKCWISTEKCTFFTRLNANWVRLFSQHSISLWDWEFMQWLPWNPIWINRKKCSLWRIFVLSKPSRFCQWLRSLLKYKQLKISLLVFTSNPWWSGNLFELCHCVLVHLWYYLPDPLCYDLILMMNFLFISHRGCFRELVSAYHLTSSCHSLLLPFLSRLLFITVIFHFDF